MTTLVVDTSAAVALLIGDRIGAKVIDGLEQADTVLMSAASYAELGIVLETRLGPVGGTVASRFVTDAGVRLVPVDRTLADAAMTAYRRFGRGHHPAGLNYGDCFTYATASLANAAVLHLGDDFTRTDIETVTLEP